MLTVGGEWGEPSAIFATPLLLLALRSSPLIVSSPLLLYSCLLLIASLVYLCMLLKSGFVVHKKMLLSVLFLLFFSATTVAYVMWESHFYSLVSELSLYVQSSSSTGGSSRYFCRSGNKA